MDLTLGPASDAGEAAEALSAQKVSKNISEGASSSSSSSQLGALLHAHLPLGLSSPALADLRALRAGVGVAAAGERPGQPLLSRNHLEPISCGGEKQGENTNVGFAVSFNRQRRQEMIERCFVTVPDRLPR